MLDPEFVGTTLASYAEITGETLAETLAAWPDHGAVDLLEELSILTMRVITQSLFSRDTTRERGRTVHDAMAPVNAEFEADPLDAVLPESLQSGRSEAFEEADAVLEDIAREFVDWHLDHDDPPDDVITALMEAKRDPDIELSDNELIDQTILFMTGGQETTALTIVYAHHRDSRIWDDAETFKPARWANGPRGVTMPTIPSEAGHGSVSGARSH